MPERERGGNWLQFPFVSELFEMHPWDFEIFFFQNAHQKWQGIKRITAWKLLRAGDHSWAEVVRSW